MTKGVRGDPLEKLIAQQQAIDKAREDLDKKSKPLHDKIAEAAEQREREDNQYLGAVVRLLLKNDSGLRHKLVAHANEVIETTKHKVKAKASLLRTLGPLPAPEVPATASVKSAGHEFVSRGGK